MEEQPDFGSHLGEPRSTLPTHRFIGVLIPFWVGRPLHPHYKVLVSQFESLDDVLPTESISFALSSSGLIPSPRFSEFGPSPPLVQHLRSILPEYVPGAPDPSPDPESDSSMVKTTASNEDPGQHPTTGFSLPTIPVPTVNLNVDMRNLKWNWPGYLTFGKNSKDKERQKGVKANVNEQKPGSEPESKPDAGGEGEASEDVLVAEGDTPCSDPPKEEEKVEVEVEVDTLSLADAMESENSRGGSSSAHSRAPSETPPSPTIRTIEPIPDDDATPTATQPPDPDAILQGVNEISQLPASTEPPSPGSEEGSHPVTSEPPPPPVMFSQTLVHLAPPGHPLRTTERRLYYLTVRHPPDTFFSSRSELTRRLAGNDRKRISPLP